MSLPCPNCGHEVPPELIARERGRQLGKHLPNTARPKLCEIGCGQQFSGREMRKHIPECRARAKALRSMLADYLHVPSSFPQP